MINLNEFYIYIFFFTLGMIIGSFLNVCICRIPEKKSIVFPPSSCPSCGYLLKPLDLIPVLSFVFLKGKCRSCGSKISFQYPVVEIVTGLLFLAVYWKFGLTGMTFKVLLLVSVLIVIAIIDLKEMIIPNVLSLPGVALGLALSYFDRTLLGSVIGAVGGFIIIAAIIWLSRGGMGWGDAKLLAMIGAFSGWQAVLYSLFLGSFIGSIAGLYLILAKKINRKTPIPFGPYICLGLLIYIFFNDLAMFPMNILWKAGT